MKQQFHIFIEGSELWLSAELVSKIDTFLKLSSDTVHELSICGVKSKRSAAQNRLYWVIMDMCVEAGKSIPRFEKWQTEHYHIAAKEAFLRGMDETVKKVITRSTTDLTVEEMSKYIDNVIDIILVKTLHGTFSNKYESLLKESKGV